MLSQPLIDLVTSWDFWIVIGFIGQFMFTMRFVVQWMASEKARKCIVPVSFWFFSLAGGAILFAYAIHKQDPVFITGQGMGLLIYIRNLYFVLNEHRKVKLSTT